MISARVLGTSSAPAIPWAARAPIRNALLGAIAHSSEATPKPISPAANTRASPEQVPQRPADQQQ